MIAKFILERAIAMLPIASDDRTRYHIAGVHILSKEGSVTLTATNGHMLLTRDIHEAICPSGEFILRQDAAPALKIVLKEHKFPTEIECSIDTHGGLFIGSDRGAKARIEKMEGSYPNVAQVIPEHTDKVAITLNADYLLAIADALKGGDKRVRPIVRIVFDPLSATRPVLIERESESDFKAVIMPVRDSGTDAIARERRELAEEECV